MPRRNANGWSRTPARPRRPRGRFPLCAACGKAVFGTREAALARAVSLAAAGLRGAYRCGAAWHITRSRGMR